MKDLRTGEVTPVAFRPQRREAAKMTTLSMRYLRGDFVVTGPDIEPVRFKTRREAWVWCFQHHPGSPVKVAGADVTKRAAKGKAPKAGRSK